jgi:hypothetical protein
LAFNPEFSIAVDNDDVNAHRREKRDVVSDARARDRIGIIHETAAVLHDKRGATEILDVGKSLEEDFGLSGDFGNVYFHRKTAIRVRG